MFVLVAHILWLGHLAKQVGSPSHSSILMLCVVRHTCSSPGEKNGVITRNRA